jgi:hypothetical protein
MTYELKYEPVTVKGIEYPKYNIYYSGGQFDGLKEFHSLDGNGPIREGYKQLGAPDWNGLTQDLKNSPLMLFAYQYANPNGFNLFLKTLTDGENSSASEGFLLTTIGMCQLSFSTTQKAQLNQMLADNNFTIRVS